MGTAISTFSQYESPGCNPGSRMFSSVSSSVPFLQTKVSEMSHRSSESTQKRAVYSRQKSLAEVQSMIRDLAMPLQPGDNQAAQINRAYRAIKQTLPSIKYSRVRDFWYGDARVRVRDEEGEGIADRWAAWLDDFETFMSRAHARHREILMKRKGRSHAAGDDADLSERAAGASSDSLSAHVCGRLGE